jgi:hypothetical protein
LLVSNGVHAGARTPLDTSKGCGTRAHPAKNSILQDILDLFFVVGFTHFYCASRYLVLTSGCT